VRFKFSPAEQLSVLGTIQRTLGQNRRGYWGPRFPHIACRLQRDGLWFWVPFVVLNYKYPQSRVDGHHMLSPTPAECPRHATCAEESPFLCVALGTRVCRSCPRLCLTDPDIPGFLAAGDRAAHLGVRRARATGCPLGPATGAQALLGASDALLGAALSTAAITVSHAADEAPGEPRGETAGEARRAPRARARKSQRPKVQADVRWKSRPDLALRGTRTLPGVARAACRIWRRSGGPPGALVQTAILLLCRFTKLDSPDIKIQ